MHGPIAEDVYVDFARSLFTEREKTIEEDPIRWAFKLFDGNTFYMQRTMNGAFADTPSGTTCGHDTVARAVRSMLAANEVIYREILSTIKVSQKATPSSSSVQSALIKLSRAGLISKGEDGYSLSDPLLRIFINGLYSTPEV